MIKMGATVRGTKVGNGRGNPKHNMRDFTEEEKNHPDQANIDFNRTELNIIIKRETFEEAYNREFENVWDRYAEERRKAYELKLEKYESGQVKRKPRPSEHAPLKETPWEKYSDDGNSQTHLEMEYIFHVGGHADFNTEYTDKQRKNIPTGLSQEECDARWEKANGILKDFCAHIEKKYPKMIGVQIDLHNDEGYPHVHWRGFFKADGNTFKQAGNSPYRALKEMGVPLPQKLPESQYKAILCDILRDDMDEVMKNHGWEREHKLTSGTRKLEVFQQIEEAQLQAEHWKKAAEQERRAFLDAKMKTQAEIGNHKAILDTIVENVEFDSIVESFEEHKKHDPTFNFEFKTKQTKGKKEKEVVIINKKEFDFYEKSLHAKNLKNSNFKLELLNDLKNEHYQKHLLKEDAIKPIEAIQKKLEDSDTRITNSKIEHLENKIDTLSSENRTLKSRIQEFSMRFEREDEVDKENKNLKSENRKLREENKLLKNENSILTDFAIRAYEFSKKQKERFKPLEILENYLDKIGIKEITERRNLEIEQAKIQKQDFENTTYQATYELIRKTAYHDSPYPSAFQNKNTWYKASESLGHDNYKLPQTHSEKLTSHPYFDSYVEEYKKKKPNLRHQDNNSVLKEIINEHSGYIQNDIRHNNIDITREKWNHAQNDYGKSNAEVEYQPVRTKSISFSR